MSAVLNLVSNTKKCAKCHQVKVVTEFHKHSDGGFQPRCKACRKIEQARKHPDKRKTVQITENGRTCLKCGEAKSWNEFANDRHGFNKKTADCKECRQVKHKIAYDNNPKVRRSGLKNRPDKVQRLYGVTYEHVVRTLDTQHGLCANRACGQKISLDVKGNTKERAVIDHDHTTGKFRALLCSPCNLILGTIENNENRIIGLMEYKTKYDNN